MFVSIPDTHGTAIYAAPLTPLAPPLAVSRQSGLAVPLVVSGYLDYFPETHVTSLAGSTSTAHAPPFFDEAYFDESQSKAPVLRRVQLGPTRGDPQQLIT